MIGSILRDAVTLQVPFRELGQQVVTVRAADPVLAPLHDHGLALSVDLPTEHGAEGVWLPPPEASGRQG